MTMINISARLSSHQKTILVLWIATARTFYLFIFVHLKLTLLSCLSVYCANLAVLGKKERVPLFFSFFFQSHFFLFPEQLLHIKWPFFLNSQLFFLHVYSDTLSIYSYHSHQIVISYKSVSKQCTGNKKGNEMWASEEI